MSREGEVPAGVERKKFPSETDHDESPKTRPNDLRSKVKMALLLFSCFYRIKKR